MNRSDAYREGYLAELARQVAKGFSRDNASKQRIMQRSPQAFYGMDAEELGTASAAELATRELKELGITAKASDPIELLDAHHAGRQFARGRGPGTGGPLMGGKPSDIFNPGARDASDDSVVGRYLRSEK